MLFSVITSVLFFNQAVYAAQTSEHSTDVPVSVLMRQSRMGDQTARSLLETKYKATGSQDHAQLFSNHDENHGHEKAMKDFLSMHSSNVIPEKKESTTCKPSCVAS